MDVPSNAAAGAVIRPVGQKPQPRSVHGGAAHSFLALTALGVVFGDIGTSPLYAFSVALNATGHGEPTAADVFGIVSLTFWALMLIVSLKYVVFVLRADNDGEGGILALLSLVEHGGSRFKLPIAVAARRHRRLAPLRRRRHHAGDFGSVRHRRPQVQPGGGGFRRAGDPRDPGGAVRHPVPRHATASAVCSGR